MATKNDLPFYKCPRYSKCSVNNCPLHPVYPHMLVCPEDKELKCGIAKNIRIRIAAEFPGVLKMGGLTKGEQRAKDRYANLSCESKAKMQESLNKINSKRALEADKNFLDDLSYKV